MPAVSEESTAVGGCNGVQGRDTAGGAAVATTVTGISDPVWVAIQDNGVSGGHVPYSGYYSLDSTT